MARTQPVTRGSPSFTPNPFAGINILGGPSFDWYEATVFASPETLRNRLEDAFGSKRWSKRKPRQGYASYEILWLPEGGEVSMLWGGCHERPHIQLQSVSAALGVTNFREVGILHTVSRVDSAIDLVGADAFEVAHETMVRTAKTYRVAVLRAGDWDLGGPRTVWLGAKASDVRIRLYERGKHLVVNRGMEAMSNSIRFEVQIGPKSVQRYKAASWQPTDVWCARNWTTALYNLIMRDQATSLGAERKKLAFDGRRSEDHMFRQYRRVFLEICARVGSWEAVGPYIGDRLQSDHQPRISRAISETAFTDASSSTPA